MTSVVSPVSGSSSGLTTPKASSASSTADWLKSKKFDYLRCASNEVLIRFLDKNSKGNGTLESVQFSDEVVKINKRGRNQKRELIITNTSVYNFEPKKYRSCQREIAISQLRGIVLSTTSDEVLIQVKGDYCYRLLIVRKADVLTCLTHLYETITGAKLPLSSSADIGKLQVLKEDVKKMGKKSPSNAADEEKSKSADELKSPSKVPATPRSQPLASPSSTSEPVELVVAKIEGWLSKRGVVNNVWRRRFFRLNESNILYYEPKLKGSTLIEAGELRAWSNQRASVSAKVEASSPVRASSEATIVQPHFLRGILNNPERCEDFVRYCEARYSTEEVRFYLSVDQFRRMEECAERDMVARRIFDTHIKPGAPATVSLPGPLRDELVSAFMSKGFKPDIDTFDEAQRAVLQHMTMSILPGFFDEARSKRQSTKLSVKSTVDATLKEALTEDDKKIQKCKNCAAGFTMLRRRNFCKHCGDVFCNQCVTKTCIPPPEFNHPEPIRVCDMCHSTLESNNHPHAFSYIPARKAAVNFAANDSDDMTSWMTAFQKALTAMTKSGREREAELRGVHKEGWLIREDPTTKAWKKRYLVLDGERLYHYEFILKGSMTIIAGAGVHSNNQVESTIPKAECIQGGFTSDSGFAYRFTISHRERLYNLAADNSESMASWIEAIERTLRKPRKGGSDVKKKKVVSLEQYTASFNEEAPVGEVTFVFTDVQNSTKLWETAPTGMNKGLEAHDALLRALLKVFRGYEVKTEGDAFMVTFFSALDAIRWCLAVQKGLLELKWPDELNRLPYSSTILGKNGKPVFAGIRVRMGIHVGNPQCRRNPVTGRMDYFGPVVNRSARVSDSAHGGQIVCTEEVQGKLAVAQADGSWTRDIRVDALGAFPYKGISEPVKVWQITDGDLVERTPFPPLRLEKGESKEGEKKDGGDDEGDESSDEEVDEQEIGEFDEDEDTKEERDIAAKVAQETARMSHARAAASPLHSAAAKRPASTDVATLAAAAINNGGRYQSSGSINNGNGSASSSGASTPASSSPNLTPTARLPAPLARMDSDLHAWGADL